MKYAQWIITFSNGFRISETVVTSWIIMAFLIIASYFLTRNLKLIPTSKVQIMLEYAVVTLKNLVESNIGWALLTVFLIYFEGMKSKGLAYWKGLLEPVPFLLPLNIVSEIATPISLTFRPFGNILGGTVIMGLLYQLLAFISTLIPGVSIPFLQLVIPVPLHLYFDLFSGCLQAFIFVMLTMVFISNTTE